MKKSKEDEQKAKLAALLGLDVPKPTLTPTESPVEVSRQAEATSLYAEGIAPYIRKDCKNCGKRFAHTPGAVAFCSDTCRAADLLKIGIKWDWGKPAEERWKRNDPLVVPTEALKLVDELTDTRDSEKCPVYNHMRDTPEHGAWCWGDKPVPDGMVMVPYDMKEPAVSEDINQLVLDIYAPRVEWEQERHDALVERLGLEPEPEPEPEPDFDPATLDILKDLGLT